MKAKPMRKIVLMICALALLSMCASAHPGDTDENGGHYDHSTGEYHYHHGYPAHQHTGGVCPYDYDNRTGGNSGTVSASQSDNARSSIPVEVEKHSFSSLVNNINFNTVSFIIIILCAIYGYLYRDKKVFYGEFVIFHYFARKLLSREHSMLKQYLNRFNYEYSGNSESLLIKYSEIYVKNHYSELKHSTHTNTEIESLARFLILYSAEQHLRSGAGSVRGTTLTATGKECWALYKFILQDEVNDRNLTDTQKRKMEDDLWSAIREI